VLPQAFDICDQTGGGIAIEGGVRSRMAATTLVEKYDAVACRIEEPAMISLATGPRPAVQEYRRQTVGPSAFLHV
jgi:hypothetical protein